jgi:hypothetical protein
MNQAPFFEAGYDVGLPSGGGAYPVEKGAAVARVAQRGGSDDPHAVGGVTLHGAMKALQYLDGERHGLRIERTVGEDALAETRYFAVLVKRLQAAADYFGNLQANGVGTDVNRSECGHGSSWKSRNDYFTRANVSTLAACWADSNQPVSAQAEAALPYA